MSELDAYDSQKEGFGFITNKLKNPNTLKQTYQKTKTYKEPVPESSFISQTLINQ